MARFKMVETNGIKLRVALEGPEDGPLVLFVHGFPESWYSWRHQLRALAGAGYRAAAVDVRGYGGSDKPHAVEAYDMETITADIAGVAAALQPGAPCVVVGHDWGAPIAWNSALVHPDQFRAVAGLSVPYMPPGDKPAIQSFRDFFTARGMFFYQVYFQDQGPPEEELEADPAASIRRFYYAISGDAPEGTWPKHKKHGDTLLHRLPEPDMPLPWLSEEDVAYYASEFRASGFRGPLNRYRNHERDHAFLTSLEDHRIHQPSLFIGGTRDLVLAMFRGDPVEAMKPWLPGLKSAHLLEGCGHWTQQERPDEVNTILLGWLNSL
ncbi:MAG: epoxide hydrolase [Henriciella sp.]|jgi:pimeloyl-ACP methyl ester carboxylesterase|uniref:alpha/beta fold hydrolase n=1 Tax=Henriciella sp. TaxID=1968823 RepID=UPI000C105613|nr:alpha/beta hydrolase [Henriciella sp.]MAN73935.1 epoxide hydrolase [Henriciella sp.]MBF34105.1 epoxide hydrolase [Hyphomonadaceae bacterium]MBK75320.1 epoxide hydrolase [Henriciella sp.]PHR79643.1 MAG: epoxide hydrolase [Henriciella sp.]|tara:strand:- start:17728 stop:18696 length:969 start_codon:yes stop_codon:yes gene_type:complete